MQVCKYFARVTDQRPTARSRRMKRASPWRLSEALYTQVYVDCRLYAIKFIVLDKSHVFVLKSTERCLTRMGDRPS